jgi:hypothetical protein
MLTQVQALSGGAVSGAVIVDQSRESEAALRALPAGHRGLDL